MHNTLSIPDLPPADPRQSALSLAVKVGLLTCAIYGPFYVWMGYPLAGLVVMLASIPIAVALFVARWCRTPQAGLELMHLTAFGVLTWITWYQGGLVYSPAVWWLLVVPYLALTSGGYRSAGIWFAVVMATILGFFIAQSSGAQPVVRMGTAPLLNHAVNVSGLILIVLVFLALVERARKRALDDQRALIAKLKESSAILEARNEQLARAHDAAVEADRVKGQFLANMSHEIRTPMNGVLGMAELLGNTRLAPEQQQYLNAIKTSGEHLLTLINDILDISKLDAGKMAIEDIDFNPREVAEDVTELMAQRAFGKGLHIDCVLAPDVPALVRGDAHRLRQILSNLLSNAVKFTERGAVSLEVDVFAGATQPDPGLRCVVRDSGIGIASDVLGKLFQPFTQADGSTTRRYGGSGLGLSIARQLARQMGGDISVQSVLGVGSTFCLWLPLHRSAEFTPVPAWTGREVFIAQSHELSARALNAQLAALGIRVQTVLTPVTADTLDQTRRGGAAALLLSYDALPADWTWAKLRAAYPLPCIVCVPIDQLETSAALTQADLAVISMPFRRARLQAVLEATFAITSAQVPELPVVPVDLGLSVLVAEDNPVNRKVAGAMLKRLGCSVRMAEDGATAVRLWAAQRFDVILMDCQMPVLDGFGATRAIRKQERARSLVPIPIIAITANALHDDRALCLAAGMTDYLSKPYTLQQLEQRLANCSALSTSDAGPPVDATASA